MTTVAHMIRPVLWLGLALVLACAAPNFPAPAGDQALAALIQAYPCDVGPAPPAAVARALRTAEAYENELHDCQRLVQNGQFGALVGLFPRDSVMRLGTFPANGAVVASVFNWGDWQNADQAYAPLGIPSGLSCLWLEPAGDAGWSALLLAPQDPDAGCAGTTPATAETVFEDLDVHAVSAPGGVAIPASARWDWDAQGAAHVIGVRCGAAWCFVGRTGFQTPSVPATPGLYDRQHVAVTPQQPSRAPLQPGPLATIYPDSQLATRTFETLERAARIVVEGRGWQRYRNKLFLEASADQSRGEVEILLQRMDSTTMWGVYRQPVSGDTASAQGVVWTRNVMHGAIGAARWRWQRQDEGAWISCTNGCCDVSRSVRSP